MTFVLDSSAVLCWLRQEQRWQAINKLLTQPGSDPVLPGPGLAEVIVNAHRKGNVTSGPQIRQTLEGQNVRVVQPTDDDLVRAAELIEISAAHPYYRPQDKLQEDPHTLSMADAIILAISESNGWIAITRDATWGWLATQGHTSVNVQTF